MSTTPKSFPQTLADVVAVRRRFSRSVHLERDWKAQNHQARSATDYHLTPSAYELLKIIAGGWERPSDRALTVVGPYGAGKSAFCVFLAGLGQRWQRRKPYLARTGYDFGQNAEQSQTAPAHGDGRWFARTSGALSGEGFAARAGNSG